MKNKILAALLTVALVGTMTACGNKSEGGSTDSSNTQSSSSTASTDTEGGEDTMLGADSATVRLKVGTTTAPEGHYVKGLQEMQKLLEEYSDGEMTLDIYPNSQLGNERDMMENVGMGVQEMCLIHAFLFLMAYYQVLSKPDHLQSFMAFRSRCMSRMPVPEWPTNWELAGRP